MTRQPIRDSRGLRAKFHSLADATFRANPEYELIEFGRLDQSIQEEFRPLSRDPDFFGVVCPRTKGLFPVRSVCRNTALLFLALQRPGSVPTFLREHDPAIQETLIELLLNSILEIELPNGFVGGPAASVEILEPLQPVETESRLAQLSLAAIKYAQHLSLKDLEHLSARLYCYNRHPVSSLWAKHSIAEWYSKDPVARRVGDKWIVDHTHTGWCIWRWAENRGGAAGNYKLYFSPQAEETPLVFGKFIQTMTELRAPCFKVGKGVAGLLRPDKIVAYFETFEDLALAAAAVRDSIGECRVQGVPFTAEAGQDGLLSWGIDPPTTIDALPWQRVESWRLWVARRIAEAIIDCRLSSCEVEPWRFALQRLRFAGVDPARWVPPAGFQTHP